MFWNNSKVFYFNLKDTKSNDLMKLKPLNFIVDPELKETYIKKVRAGSNPDKIAIGIRQSSNSEAVIIWDIE